MRIAVAVSKCGKTAVVGPDGLEPGHGQMESAVEILWQELVDPEKVFFVDVQIPEKAIPVVNGEIVFESKEN